MIDSAMFSEFKEGALFSKDPAFCLTMRSRSSLYLKICRIFRGLRLARFSAGEALTTLSSQQESRQPVLTCIVLWSKI